MFLSISVHRRMVPDRVFDAEPGSTWLRTVRQVARIDVVEHVEVIGLAVRLCRIGQVFQVADDRLDAGLEDVRAVAPVARRPCSG